MADAQTTGGGAATPRSDYCIFMRDGQRFALATTIAKEILEARPFTPVPYAPPELLGAFNLRGEVVPLVNLDRFLNVTERPAASGDTLLLLCQGDVTMAAVVDQVVIIKHVSPWEIRRAKLEPSLQNPLVRGLVGRDEEQTMVLDGERLVAGVVEQIAAGLRGTRGKGASAATMRATASGEAAAVRTAGDAGAGDEADATRADGTGASGTGAAAPAVGAETPAGGR